jgi:hypothetical protein
MTAMVGAVAPGAVCVTAEAMEALHDGTNPTPA